MIIVHCSRIGCGGQIFHDKLEDEFRCSLCGRQTNEDGTLKNPPEIPPEYLKVAKLSHRIGGRN